MTTRILIVDDHHMIVSGLRALLRSEPGMEVVGEAADGATAVRLAEELAPNVVVMDVGLPDLNGIDATRRILATAADAGRQMRVIALSAFDNPRYIREMLRVGATAYVSKASAFEELAQAISAVLAGQVYLSPSVADAIVDDLRSGGGGSGGPDGTPASEWAFHKLSPREREVLQVMSEGKSTKEIARHLSISVKTVETHRRKVMEKLDLWSVAELTKYAIREGLTTAER